MYGPQCYFVVPLKHLLVIVTGKKIRKKHIDQTLTNNTRFRTYLSIACLSNTKNIGFIHRAIIMSRISRGNFAGTVLYFCKCTH